MGIFYRNFLYIIDTMGEYIAMIRISATGKYITAIILTFRKNKTSSHSVVVIYICIFWNWKRLFQIPKYKYFIVSKIWKYFCQTIKSRVYWFYIKKNCHCFYSMKTSSCLHQLILLNIIAWERTTNFSSEINKCLHLSLPNV